MSDQMLNSQSDPGEDQVVFLVQYCGKTVGELGVSNQDLNELNWTKFKSYLVS